MSNGFNIGIIGERINPGFKSPRALFDNQDLPGIQALAIKQAKANGELPIVNSIPGHRSTEGTIRVTGRI